MIKNLLKKINDIELRWYHYLLVFVFSFFLIMIRRLDMFAYPQFWAEDGTVWFEDAFNTGFILPLLTPVAGYLQTISRLGGAFSLLFSPDHSPLIFNLIAITVKILPILFIFSNRFKKILPGLWSKILIALVYIALPNTSEVFVNLTNAQWHLAILAFLIIVATPSTKKYWRIFDGFFIALSCLSGPFCVFLFPVVVINYYWADKEKRKLLKINYLIFFLFSFLQFLFIVNNAFSARGVQEHRYSLGILIKLVSGQIFTASLIGKEGYAELYTTTLHYNDLVSKLFSFLTFITGISILLFSYIKGSRVLKLFIIFCFTTFTFALIRPMVPSGEIYSQWYIMSIPGNALRYFFFPMLAFLMSVIFLLGQKEKRIKIIGIIILVIFVWGTKYEFFYKPWPDLEYKKQIQKIERLQPGEMLEIEAIPKFWRKTKIYKK